MPNKVNNRNNKFNINMGYKFSTTAKNIIKYKLKHIVIYINKFSSKIGINQIKEKQK